MCWIGKPWSKLSKAFAKSASFQPGDRVKTLRGSTHGVIKRVLNDGRVVWQPEGTKSELMALPESLVREKITAVMIFPGSARLIQLPQHFAERGQPGHGHAGLCARRSGSRNMLSSSNGRPQFEIQKRGRLVSAHRPRAFDLFLGKGNGNFKAQPAGGGDDFQHQFAQEFFPAWVGEQLVGGQNRLTS